MNISRSDAERFVLPDFGMDPSFPKTVQCDEQHIKYMLQVVWPLRQSFGRVLVAQEAMATYTTVGMFAVGDCDLDHLGPGHVFFIDNPGKGKSLFAQVPSKVIGGTYARYQGTPDSLPSDYTGNRIIDVDDNNKKVFRLVKGPGFADLQLLDEITRTTPRTQSAMLEALGEGTITIAGETHRVTPFAILTANPIESEGTFPLSEAFLDRIMFQIRGDVFTKAVYAEILERTRQFQKIKLKQVCDIKKIAEIRAYFFNTIHISKEIEDLIGRFAEITNDVHTFGFLNDLAEQFNDDIVIAGLSGRGAIHLLGAARTIAAFRYRNYVIPDDVYTVLLLVLRHRFVFRRGVLSFFRSEWKQDTILDTRDTIITQLIQGAWA